KQEFLLEGHKGPVLGVTQAREGNLIASAGADGTVRVWDAETQNELLSLAGHWGKVTGVAFSPESLNLVSAGEDGKTIVWNGETGDVLWEMTGTEGPVVALAASLDAGRAAERWRAVFAGLAVAWFLAALPWLVIDTRQRIGDQDGPPTKPVPSGALADGITPANPPGPVRRSE